MVKGPLGVPLHGHDEAIGIVEFDGFDNPIHWGDSTDEEVIASGADGLVMTGVYLRFKPAAESGQTGTWGDPDRMSFGDGAARLVVDGGLELRREILVESAVARDIQVLGPMADGEDRLSEFKGVLEEDFVDGGSSGIGFSALGDAISPVSLRINIVFTAGEQDSLDPAQQIGDSLPGFAEGNNDRNRP